MKRLFLSIFVMMISITNLTAQYDGWKWVNPLPQGNTILCIQYLTENRIMAIGEAGSVMISDDGGTTWDFKGSGTFNTLYDFFFVNAATGFIVGDGGIILMTTDEGNHWSTLVSGINESLRSVWFSDQSNGYAVGANGKILKTTDAGAAWYVLSTWSTTQLNDICFVDPTTGFIAGNQDSILKTTDAGNSWYGVSWGLSMSAELINFSFTSVDTGYILLNYNGFYFLSKTVDSGENWIIQSQVGSSPKNIYFINSQTGFAPTNSGSVLKTTDAGLNWVTQYTNNDEPLYSIYFFDEISGVAAGKYGALCTTTNGGDEWEYESPWIIGDLYSLCITPSGFGYALGLEESKKTTKVPNGNNNDYSGSMIDQYRIYRSMDLINWFPSPGISGHALRQMIFINDSLGFICTMEGDLYKTTNFGSSWLRQNPPVYGLRSLSFTNDSTGFSVGDDGLIIKTTNGGTNWFEQTSGTTYDLRYVFFPSHDTGYVIGTYGESDNPFAVYKTTNGGNQWFMTYTASTTSPRKMYFLDTFTGFAVGYFGLVMKTTDGGYNWFNQNSGTSENLNTVHFPSADTGYIVGNNGVILKTTNGGEIWFRQKSNCGNDLKSCVFTRADDGIAIGEHGTILRTTNGGMTFIVEQPGLQRPTKVILNQNYPNPFNPSTTIRYQLPANAKVSVKIYNTLGQEVATLVDKREVAGTHTVQWNGKDRHGNVVSSGMYLYRIDAVSEKGKFVQTKKMVLIK